MRSFRASVLATLVIGVALVGSAASHAASISGPSSSTTGTFTLTWTSGYYLHLSDVYYRISGPPSTSYNFSNLPSGTYKYELWACYTSYETELGYLTWCSVEPNTQKTVTVTRDTEPALDTTTTEAGTSAYVAAVTLRGSSRVSIPIKTIAGVNGVGPRLALEYDSARGTDVGDIYALDDTLGYGWYLSGLSRIHRCRGGVSGGGPPNGYDNYDLDRLCLDGMPLRVVSGSYGANDSVYRTEAQSSVKVTKKSGNWFEVRYPDGSVAKYGSSTDSPVGASGAYNNFTGDVYANATYVWGLNEITGALGDTMTIAYEKFDGYGAIQPKTISYAGATVAFSYGPRSDVLVRALGYGAAGHSSLVRRQSVLNKITVSKSGTPVREYRLDSNLVNNQLRLENLQECGYTTSGTLDACLKPLTFGWTSVSGGSNNYNIAISSVQDGVGKRTEYLYAALTATTNPLAYTEAPFGSTMTVANTTAQSLAAVSEMKVSDGLSSTGRRRFTYGYKGFPYRSSVGRGFIGFYEVREKDEQSGIYTYTQTRLDFPFLNVVSQKQSVNAVFGSHSQTLHREENAFGVKNQTGGVVYPYLARAATRLAFEYNTTVSAEEETTVLCYRTLVGGVCPGSGTEGEFPTQQTTTREIGDDISNPTFTPTFWGDVPDRSIVGTQHTTVMTTDLTNATGTPWTIGNPTKQVQQATAAGETAKTTTHTATHFSGTSVPATVTRLLGTGATEYTLTTTLSATTPKYVSGVFASGSSIASRGVTFDVSSDHRYVTQATNALSQATDLQYDDRAGDVSTITDPDNNLTTIEYDAFGRKVRTTAQDGTEVVRTYERCDLADCSAAVNADVALKVTTSTSNGAVQTAPTTVTYYDVLGREVLSEVEALDSADGGRRQRTEYDNRNRVQYVSIPYFSTAATPTCTAAGTNCTWYSYDARDRVTREDRPDGGYTITDYADAGAAGAVTVTVTETVKQAGSTDVTRAKRSTFDALGLLTSTTDAYGTGSAITTSYDYDSHGNLDTVVVNGVAIASMGYDLAGNRTSLTDANVGTWPTFEYDALGNLTRTVDAKGQDTRYDYDLLNRLRHRTDRYGTGNAVTNEWTWDAPYATAQLAARSSPGFSETYTYRAADGKLESVETDIDVAGVHSGSYTRTFGYDAYGRLESLGYPSGSTFTVAYNGQGYAYRLLSGSTVLEDVQDTNAFGQASVTAFANGLKTVRGYDPATGRLSSIQTGPTATPKSIQDLEYAWRSNSTLYKRLDKRNTTSTADDYTDTFSYDALERLTAQTTTVGATRTLDFGYDAYGNLTSKTSNVTGDLDVTGYGYGISGKPHRLASVTIGTVVNTLTYDANGSITNYNAASGDDTDLVYDGQNNVTSITVGAAPTARDEFWYDPDGQRFLGQETWQSSGTKTAVTVYLGNFEEVIPASGSAYNLVQRTDVSDSIRHVRTRTTAGVYASRFEYLHRDHLGSVHAITDAAGALLNNKTPFDPFGGRRAANWASDISTADLNTLRANEDERWARGFTDHEMLNRTGFIHMNGRVYDPRIGRFVSADPIVQAPFHSQSYNRYSYVFSSPMSYRDPSGFVPSEFLFGAIADSSSYTIDLYSAYAARLAKWERKDPGSYRKWLKETDEAYFRAVEERARREIAESADQTIQFDRASDGLWFGFSAGLALEHEAALPALPMVVAIVGSVASRVISRIVSRLWPRARHTADDAASVADDAAKSAAQTVVRTTRSGEKAVRITRADGSVIDISTQRVKEYVPNTHPNAPPGTLQRVQFPNAQPGSKGLKRDPTPEELEFLRNLP